MDVATIGESMVLLTPDGAASLEQAITFTKRLAGAESNVAIGLARLGHQVAWISKVGEDGFGRFILKSLRGEGVDVSGVLTDSSRQTGVFFKEKVYGLGTNVQYYRRESAASELRMEDIKHSLFDDCRIFHITGVTPALSSTNCQTVLSLLDMVRRKGVQISFDPNIRHKLWSIDVAVPTLRLISKYADVVLPGIDEGKILTEEETPEKIANWFLAQGCKLVVVKLGMQGAYFQNSKESGYVKGFEVSPVDEVGAGDAFAAGLLSGILDSISVEESVRRGCALGALAVCGKGDYETAPTRAELFRFLANEPTKVNR